MVHVKLCRSGGCSYTPTLVYLDYRPYFVLFFVAHSCYSFGRVYKIVKTKSVQYKKIFLLEIKTCDVKIEFFNVVQSNEETSV